jgi:Kef-type K+ transport system membrane component KefB
VSLFTLLICVVVAEIGSRIHLDSLVVMLTAGIWLRNFSRANAGELLRALESAQLPVFLVFFATAGSKIDVAGLARGAIPVAALAAARALAFFLGSRSAAKATGANELVTRYVWFASLPQSGMALALALLIERTFPSFGVECTFVMFGVIGVNELVGPVLLKRALQRSGEGGKRVATDFADH